MFLQVLPRIQAHEYFMVLFPCGSHLTADGICHMDKYLSPDANNETFIFDVCITNGKNIIVKKLPKNVLYLWGS